jgi:hypothetical protein
MKLRKIHGAILAVLLSQIVAVSAADLFLVNLQITGKSFDGSDRLTRTRQNTTSILRDYLAAQEEPTNSVRDLRLVYDVEGDRIAIAHKNGEILADVLAFGSGTTISNSTDTLRERHVFVFLPEDSVAVGSGVISERLTYDGDGNLIRLSSKGSFQYVNPGDEETPQEISTGTFSIGRKLVVPETNGPVNVDL